MTKLVQQRTASDCAICCFAMLRAWAYEKVLADVGDAFDPAKGLANESLALERLGYKPGVTLTSIYANAEDMSGDFVTFHCQSAIAPAYFLKTTWGRRALMSVPSLNKPDSWHMVFWSGREVFDPSLMKRYDHWQDLRPSEIVLFREFGSSNAEKALGQFTKLIEPLRARARELGYALGVHGSLARDIDLIAMPWTSGAVPAPELAEQLRLEAAKHNGGAAFDTDRRDAANPDYFRDGCPGGKAHGRLTWTFHLGDGPYIDLSVMPPNSVRGIGPDQD